MGFFEASKIASKGAPASLIPQCGACGLYKKCRSPKIPVSGNGRKNILIVTGSPALEDDADGQWLVGPGGDLLRQTLKKFDVSIDRDCWKTGALICRSETNPFNEQIDYCRPNLVKAMNELQPHVVILLGAAAASALLSPLWKESIGTIAQWAGWKIPLQKWNAWICPTFSPEYVLDNADRKEAKVIKLWFERHIEEALSLSGRPWEEVPNYRDQVRIVMDPRKAAVKLREWVEDGSPTAFDYETNRLRPDPADAEIVCASVCWKGIETIAFPWCGDAVTAMGEYLRSDVPKIGANNKFEERWTRKVFGHGVNNWVWDTMLSAHHLDCRNGITSVKFQALVRLGQEDWSWSLKPYLEAEDENGVNNIRGADTRSLLTYCGIDSVVEYLIAGQQKKEMLGK